MIDVLDDLVPRLRRAETARNRAWWRAATTGDEGAYDDLERSRNALDRILADDDAFAALDAARRDPPDDSLHARTLEVVYLEALPRQVDPELSRRMNRLSTGIERDFSTYRPRLRGERRSWNDLEDVLAHETDESLLAEAWEALMAVGPRVSGRLLELVSMRNEAARSLGFDDYYGMKLAVQEQDPDDLAAFLDRVESATDHPFARAMETVDGRLAERFDRTPDELRPWHYGHPFFQRVPPVFGVDLDEIYADVDPVETARITFEGLGLPVDDVLSRSSLYEAEGKDPHAFAIDIDREGDVRILLNARPNERWMKTALHELGHAVYDLGTDRDLPWPLRKPAHTLTTEAIAMLFGRRSQDPAWMRAARVADPERVDAVADPVREEVRARMLVFARWVLVMSRFERDLYADPGGDHNARWWALKGRLQGEHVPDRPADAADWAAKIHVVVAPVYYHNYLLGECFASQLEARIAEEVSADGAAFHDDPGVGAWLSQRVFGPGASARWDELVRSATGRPLGPEAFLEEFLPAD